MRATIVEPYDVLLLKLHTEERCACVAREIRTYRRKKEIRILFITRMDERLTKKIHFVWPRQAHLYIFLVWARYSSEID